METKQESKHLPQLPWIKGAIIAGVVVLISAAIGFFFLSPIINGFIEKRIELEFAKKYPFYSLKISKLNFSVWKNRIACDSLVLTSAHSGFSCTVGRSSVSGIGWLQLLLNSEHREKSIAGLVADTRDIAVKRSGYGLSCGRLHISLADGEIGAYGCAIKPLADDKNFFAKSKYRSTRFFINIPECRITGIASSKLLSGAGYTAHSIHIDSPSLDILVDMYAKVDARITNLRMPNETLTSINKTVRIDTLTVKNGKLKYAETYARGAIPGVVTLDDIQAQAKGIANDGKPGDATVINAQANFMQGGTAKFDIVYPLSSREFSLRYSGSLSAMKIDKLNPFLTHSEYIRINSGYLERAAFDIKVTSGHSSGELKSSYKDLSIAFVNKKTGSSVGLVNQLASFIMNDTKIRKQNMPNHNVPPKTGKIEYLRKPQNTFIQVLWFSLRSGILDVLFINSKTEKRHGTK